MRKIAIISVIAASTLLLSGCDFFRTLAGRPTSADIEVKRQALEMAAAEAEIARKDSVAAAKAIQKTVEDSLAVMSKIEGTTKLSRATRRFDPATSAMINHRYYIVVGAFGDPGNAAKCLEKLDKAGFNALGLKYLGGFTAVAVNPTDRIVEAYETLTRVTELDFVPKDSWILDVSAL